MSGADSRTTASQEATVVLIWDEEPVEIAHTTKARAACSNDPGTKKAGPPRMFNIVEPAFCLAHSEGLEPPTF